MKKRIVLGLLILSTLVFRAINSNASSTVAANYEVYTVQPGETLWQIAANYPHKDLREFIYNIRSLNKITSSLQVGQDLKIPIN